MKQPQKDFHRFFDRMNGLEFEQYCARLLQQNGYKHVTITGASGDQGIDILAEKHRKAYGIQCKNYQNKVGNKAVQEAFAGRTYYKLDYAIVLTNNYFSRSAIALAEETEVLLWDRDELLRLKKHKGLFGVFTGLLISLLVISIIFLLLYYIKTSLLSI